MTRSIVTVRGRSSSRRVSVILGAILAVGCGAPADDPGQTDRAGGAIGPTDPDTADGRRAPFEALPTVVDDHVAPGVPTGPGTPSAGGATTPVPTEIVVGVAHRQGKSITWATWLNSQRPGDQRCGRREIGPCVLYDCRGTTLATGGTPVTGLDGGKLTIAGGTVEPIYMNPDADGRYMPFRQVNRNSWEVGDMVTFSSTGGAGLGFLSSALPVPEALIVIEPPRAYDEGARWLAKRTDAFPLQWQTAPGEVAVEIDETDGSETPGLDDRTMLCVFPGVQGAGSVPAEAMSSLLPSTNIDQPVTTLRIGRRTHKVVPMGQGSVSISVISATEIQLDVW